MIHRSLALCAASTAVLSLVALTACDKKTGDSAAAAPAAGTPAAPTQSNGLPMPKAGLWEQTMSREGIPPQPTKVCLDDALSAKVAVQQPTVAGASCTPAQAVKTADGYTVSAKCDMGTGGVTVSEGKASGDFQTDYTMVLTSTTTGAAVPQMNRSSQITVHAKWLGPCPADWKPGDVELPNGRRVNTVAGAPATPPAAAAKTAAK